MKIRSWLIAFLLLYGSLTLPGGEAPSDVPRLRVVSLSPSLTEIIFQLGRGNWLVGRTSACKYPPAVATIPVIGDYNIPSLEKLAALKPDIVVADNLKDPSIQNTLAALKIQFYLLPSHRLIDYTDNVRKLGELLHCPAAADREILRVNQGLAALAAQRRRQSAPPRVLLIIWDNPLITCGRQSFLNDYLHYAGAENVAAGEDKAYFKCSLEWALSRNPQIVIFPGQSRDRLERMAQARGWSATDAARQHRFYGDISEDLLFTLGPRLLDGIKRLDTLIQAESDHALP